MSVSMEWNGDKALAGFKAGKQQGLRAAAEAVLAESNSRAPIRDGALRGSGSTAVSGDEAAVGYSIIYAARQHEEIGWNHPNGGQAKFLETAVNAKSGEVGQIIAQAVKNALGS